MLYDKVYAELMPRLERELPAWILYHNAEHTRYVIAAADHLATTEELGEEDQIILRTAALFHDAGFLEGPTRHEELSCNLARQYLPRFQYSKEQVDLICSMIMATRLPQAPTSGLAKYLCDADLYYLGQEGYEDRARCLFAEFKKTGFVRSETEWRMKEVDFLTTHKYFTETASKESEPGKQLILQELKAQLTQNSVLVHKPTRREIIQDACFIIAGVVIASFGLKDFLVANHFFDGGITGMSLLVHEIYQVELSLLIFLFNLPLVIVSYFSVSKSFAIKTLVSVVLLGICLTVLPSYPMTTDKLLISIFGGVFLGIGVGLVMRAGAALDGIEVIAVYTLRRTSFTITEIILGFNIIIFTIAAFKFGVETALYSILTYFTATRTIDYVVEGLQAHTGVTIISAHSDTIKFVLVNQLGRGITVYKGERGFLPGKFDVSHDVDIIFTVITRMEMRKLNNLVRDVDPKAFIFANTIREASGGILRRRHRH